MTVAAGWPRRVAVLPGGRLRVTGPEPACFRPSGGGSYRPTWFDGVLGLRLGEPIAGARSELLEKAGLAESAELEVALGGIDGLRVPVGVKVG